MKEIYRASWIIPLFIFFISCIYRGNRNSDPADFLYSLSEPAKILIIGDSLTDLSGGFYLQEFANPNSQISYKGIHSADFAEWYFRVNEAFALEPFPDQIIVALGTNDGYRFTADEFLKNADKFNSLLKMITTARIYYCLMPRTLDAGLQPKIRDQNIILKLNPPDRSAGLIDFETPFLNAPAFPPYYLTDPIHPTSDGYRRMGLSIAAMINR